MGYQIQYGDTANKFLLHANKCKPKSRFWVSLLFCIIFIAVLALAAKDYLIPGDDSVTKSAAKTFQQEIRSGEDIGKAFAAFCKEIVDGAQLS